MSSPESAAVKNVDIDIDIVDILESEISVIVDIGNIDPALQQTNEATNQLVEC